VTGIAGTGFLVAFANRRDRHHGWAVEVASSVDRALLTCDAVLAETAFHLENVSTVIAMVQEGLVLPQLSVSDHLARLAELAERYSDRKPDLANLCLIRLSELNPTLPVITMDVRDFRVTAGAAVPSSSTAATSTPAVSAAPPAAFRSSPAPAIPKAPAENRP